MIQINKKYDSSLSIKFQNPSIQDFLVSYINEDEISKDYLLNSLLYLKSTFEILTENKSSSVNSKIEINFNQLKLLEKIVLNSFDKLEFESNIVMYSKPSETDLTIKKLHLIKIFFRKESIDINDFVKKQFLKICYSENITTKSIHQFANLLCDFANEEKFDIEKILLNISSCFWDYDDLSALSYIESTFSDEFEIFKSNNEDLFYDLYSDIVSGLKQAASDSNEVETLKSIYGELKSINDEYGFYTYDETKEIEEKIEELERAEFYDEDFPYDYYPQRVTHIDGSLENYIQDQEYKESRNIKPTNENDIINDLFKSLE